MNTATLRSLIDLRAEQQGDRIFARDPITGQSISYGELRTAARAIAAEINERGVAPGESVAYAMPNSIACAASILGIMYGGYRATAVNLISGAATIGYVLSHSDSKLVYTCPDQLELLTSVPEWASLDLPVVVVEDNSLDHWLHTDSNDSDIAVAADDEGLLMYTSGTTGQPKGVLLTHDNLISGGRNTQLAHELTDSDIALCVLPLYHINGLCVTLMGPLVSGGEVVIPPRFSASNFWSWVVSASCTWFSVVPTQISYLLHAEDTQDAGRHHVRFGRSASAPLSPDVQQQFEDRFSVPIVETMGLTETAAQILSNPLPPKTRKIGSPGLAVGCEVMVADEQLQTLPDGTEGELLIRGPNVMKGYLRNPQATEQALTPTGWLRTGDLGRRDTEGYLFITGRLKELIIKGGENIAPREVDDALYQHPAVVEAAAFPRTCKDYGQRVEAAVFVDADVDETTLLELCTASLGAFKTPDRIHFMDELPKGPSGKIQRRRLSELFDKPNA